MTRESRPNYRLVGSAEATGKRSLTTMKKALKPTRKWSYSEELLREIAATPGSYAELARRYDVHTETVTRAKRLYRAD